MICLFKVNTSEPLIKTILYAGSGKFGVMTTIRIILPTDRNVVCAQKWVLVVSVDEK